MNIQTIYIGSVGGSSTNLKSAIIKHVSSEYKVINVNDEINDVMIAGSTVAKAVLKDNHSLGIVLCGNGFGIAKEASISEDITVINCVTRKQVSSGVQVNNANVLALGARMITIEEGIDLVDTFLIENKAI